MSRPDCSSTCARASSPIPCERSSWPFSPSKATTPSCGQSCSISSRITSAARSVTSSSPAARTRSVDSTGATMKVGCAPSTSSDAQLFLHLVDHHLGRLASDLDGEVGAAIPGIDLADGCEVEAAHGCADRRDVARVVYRWDRLSVGGLPQPAALDPAAFKPRVEALQRRQEALQQLLFREPKVLVLRGQVIATVDDVVAAIMLRAHVIGVLDHRQKWEARVLGEVVPVDALRQ